MNLINDKLRLNSGSYAHIQKIFSSTRYLSLSLRIPGHSVELMLGRGSGYEGLWLLDKPIPSSLRIRDHYLEYLRKQLTGGMLVKLELDPNDRVLYFHFQKYGKPHLFIVFYKGRESLVGLNYYDPKSKEFFKFLSWMGKEKSEEYSHLSQELRDKGLRLEAQKIDKGRTSALLGNELLKRETQDGLVKLSSPKILKKREKKLKNIKRDLEKLKKHILLSKAADRVLEMDGNEITLEGVKFKFSKKDNPYQRRDLVFQKAKGFKKALKLQEERFLETKIELEKLKERSDQLTKNVLNIISPKWPLKRETLASKPTGDSHINQFLYKGWKLFVGKDARSNDYLRNKIASKEDYWFHIDHQTSGHLICKIPPGKSFDTEDFTVFGSLLRDYSKFEGLDIPIIYAQVKNVKGLKGRAGAVLLKKPKYINVIYNQEWRTKLSSD